MERDLNGYMVPEDFDGRPARRHKRWRPGAIAIMAAPVPCQCPCRIAHPGQLANGCDSGPSSVGQVVVATSFTGDQLLLPLCGPCTAVQMDQRRRVAEQSSAGWESAFKGLGGVAVVGTVVAALVGPVLGDGYQSLWFAAGVGCAAGSMVLERRYFDRHQ